MSAHRNPILKALSGWLPNQLAGFVPGLLLTFSLAFLPASLSARIMLELEDGLALSFEAGNFNAKSLSGEIYKVGLWEYGDLVAEAVSSTSSATSTKGIIAGGRTGGSFDPRTYAIQVVTIPTTGNATDFGDLIEANIEGSAASNSVRGVIAGGYGSDGRHNVIQFITIATNGNAEYFGDLSIAKSGMSGTGNQTRAVYFGCTGASPANTSRIDSVLSTTSGN